jgi:RNA polymerase sigma factor (sigma-70 family)
MQEPRSEGKRALQQPAKLAAGNVATLFEEAYVQFAPRLRKIAIGKFRISPEDAEGLVHDVFASFFMHAESVEQVERYLIGAICNASRKHLKRAGNVLFCEGRPCAATPDDVLLRQLERKQLLRVIFSRIGARCRDLLFRYYMKGQSTAAIADDLESTPGSVYVNLHKCRKRANNTYRSITGAS